MSSGLAFAQLRVVTHNISNYAGGQVPAIQTCYYDSFQGRSVSADVIIVQEFLSATSVSDFRNALNSAPGSPGDWQSATFVNGADTDSAFFYRAGRVQFLGYTIVSAGSGASNNQPRNIMRYDVRPVGYGGAGASLACYSTHMKAGTADSDLSRRLIEAQKIRNDAESLSPGWAFLVAGDFNIQGSSEPAYQELVGSQADNSGRFFDPIKTPGSWNNSSSFRFVHTQDPATQMDDRFDQILLSSSLVDGFGFDYLGNPNVAYSTTTWNDSNHSYRAWGNDGSNYNGTLRTVGNTMVGQDIAESIIALASGQGHIPVFLDLKVPPKVSAPLSINLGNTFVGGTLSAGFQVSNSGDTNLWTAAGIGSLNYSMSVTGGFSVPSGSFADQAGGSGNNHAVTVDTSTPGYKTGVITILSNDPDQPSRTIIVRARVVGWTVR
ncbi:MAG: hypothetical protein HONBIEJF_00186 [Fimbriimonadaceae bacterium]|nr:hypothetical protein [Fimbriimonadaceae bacterium]